MLTLNQTKIISLRDTLDLYITREFDAPRELEFKALTDPYIFTKLLGSEELTISVDKYDLKMGACGDIFMIIKGQSMIAMEYFMKS